MAGKVYKNSNAEIREKGSNTMLLSTAALNISALITVRNESNFSEYKAIWCATIKKVEGITFTYQTWKEVTYIDKHKHFLSRQKNIANASRQIYWQGLKSAILLKSF